MSFSVTGGVGSPAAGGGGELMPPPPARVVHIGRSDVSTIAGGGISTIGGNNANNNAFLGGGGGGGRLGGGIGGGGFSSSGLSLHSLGTANNNSAANKIRVFACIVEEDDLLLGDHHQQQQQPTYSSTKVCTYRPDVDTNDVSDLIKLVAKKFRLKEEDLVLDDDDDNDGAAAKLYLLVKDELRGTMQAHEIDCLDDIQPNDLIALDPGHTRTRSSRQQGHNNVGTSVVETTTRATNLARATAAAAAVAGGGGQDSSDDESEDNDASSKKKRATKKKKQKKKKKAAPPKKKKTTTSDSKKKSASPATTTTKGHRNRFVFELANLVCDLEDPLVATTGATTTPSGRLLRDTPARRPKVEEQEEPVVAKKKPPPSRSRKRKTPPPPPSSSDSDSDDDEEEEISNNPKPTRAANKKSKKILPTRAQKAAGRKDAPKKYTRPFAKLKAEQLLEDDDEDDESDDDDDDERYYSVGKMVFVYDENDGYGGNDYPAVITSIKGEEGENDDDDDDNDNNKDQRLYDISWVGFNEYATVRKSQLKEYTKARAHYYKTRVYPMLKKIPDNDGDGPPPDSLKQGEDYFIKNRNDGVEYPVTLIKFHKTKPNQVYVKFKGYRTEYYVDESKLLRATPKRWKNYELGKQMTKQMEMAKRYSNSKQRSSRIKKEEPEEEDVDEEEEEKDKPVRKSQKQKRQKPQNQHQAAEEKTGGGDFRDEMYGPATPVDDLPTDIITLRVGYGSYIAQTNRIVYIACDDESASDIANKFQIPVGKVLYDNQRKWNALTENHRLKEGTPIVLPLKWNDKEVRMIGGDRGVDGVADDDEASASDLPRGEDSQPQQENDNKDDEDDESDSEMDIGEALEQGRDDNNNNDNDNDGEAVVPREDKQQQQQQQDDDEDNDESEEMDIGENLEQSGGDNDNNDIGEAVEQGDGNDKKGNDNDDGIQSVASRASSDWTDVDAQDCT